MARYAGKVEDARKQLRDMGFSQREAREKAPHLADRQESNQDRHTRPFSWLGGRATDDRDEP
jgi:hypothetical protein